MHRFFVNPEQVSDEGYIKILGSDVNHMKNVLRMRPGEELVISVSEEERQEVQTAFSVAEAGEYYCILQEYTAEGAVVKIAYQQCSQQELPCRITLYQGLPKADKMEWIIQKAVELGVHRIVPVVTRRTVVKLDPAKAAKKVARWNAISEGAAKQAGRALIPEVSPVMDFTEAVKEAQNTLDCCLIPYELAEGMENTRSLISSIAPGQSVGVLIGPEGGFDAAEVELAKSCGFSAITLGKRILRTETAGMAVLSILMYQLEDKA